jgi:hypothetical protein
MADAVILANNWLEMTMARIGKLLDEIGALKERLTPRKRAGVVFLKASASGSKARAEKCGAEVVVRTVYEKRPERKRKRVPVKGNTGRARR